MTDEQPRPRRALPPEDAFDDPFAHLYRQAPERSSKPGRARSEHADQTPQSPEPPETESVFDDGEPSADPSRSSLRRSIGLTALSTILPGAGLLGARPVLAKVVGAVVPLACLAFAGVVGWAAFNNLGRFAGFAVDPDQLRRISAVLIGIAVVWVTLITVTHLLTRPRHLSSRRRMTGAAIVTAFSLVVAAPVAVAARYSYDQQKLVETVFQAEEDVNSTSRPTIDVEQEDPWADHPRLNILLIGADGNAVRNADFGIRTDTIMLASIDTVTGNLDIIQIPRNVQYTPFPEGSDMADAFPDGFRGPGDAQEWMVNNIWNVVDRNPWYSDLFEGQTYRGAEALKQGVEGITGLKVDYFALLNIDGIQRLIDAMGGVRVNINDRLPIAEDTSRNIKPSGWLEPGPNQKLNGYDAMWYARSRSRSSDYDRMARQSCLVDAIIKQANPATMLTSYEAIAAAGADMLLTDIPQHVLQPMVELALKVKDADVERLVFSPGKNGYDYNNPDFEEMRKAVADAIDDTPEVTPTPTTAVTTPSAPETTAPVETASDPVTSATSAAPSPSATFVDGSQSVADACAYHGE